ncbi:RNA polymerase sigma factor [Georgenia halophila]
MSDPEDDLGAGQRLTALWDLYAPRVHAYAVRHVGADQAQEVVAETFLVAWRRLADIPGEGLPWLLVVARNTILADHRSRYRQRAVESELARLASLTDDRAGVDVLVTERDALLRALGSLPRRQREALLLVAWDGLSMIQAAAVAGCTVGTFKVRLHRARQRLRRAADPGADLHDPTASVTDLFPATSLKEPS